MDVRNYGKFLLVFGLLAVGLGVASPSTTTIESGICQLYHLTTSLLAAVVFVLVVLAAIVYAAGQVMGAETRARASVWATSMIIGAVLGIVIYVILPVIINAMWGSAITACDVPS